MILGVHGYARVGKDSVASAAIWNHGMVRLSFGDMLRSFALELNPYVANGRHLRDVVDHIGWEAAKDNVPEVRLFLQRTGKALRVTYGDSCLIEAMRPTMESHISYVISDVRLLPEVEAIRSWGGVVVRVTRPGVGPANDDITEIGLVDVELDGEIANDGSLMDLDRKVARYIADYTGRL